VVAVDRHTGLNIDAVMIDNRGAGMTAVEQLVKAGFRRIACICGPRTQGLKEERAIGWRDAMNATGAGDIGPLLRHADYRVEGGRRAMLELLALEDPPDAVVTTNNLMGVGAIRALTEQGREPPGFGVAVIGDLPFSTHPREAIVEIALPARYLGLTAATMLLDRIRGDRQPARTVVFRAEVS
jgi:LacI family transcriptional regulator